MTVYVGAGGVVNGGGYGSWSHEGDRLQLGWKPAGGEVIELLSILGVLPYQDGKELLFGESEQNTEDVCSPALRHAVNKVLCESMLTKARKNRDAEMIGIWGQELALQEARQEHEMILARRKVGRQRHGTEIGITRTWP